MTGNTNKARAVFLAMLMVFSVFAGTVAFSGSVAAANADAEFAGGAVHYNNTSTGAASNFVIEVPFQSNSGDEITNTTLDASNFTLLDDDTDITNRIDFNKSVANTSSTVGGSNLTVYLNTSGQAIQSNDLELELSEDVSDENGGETVNVAFAAVANDVDTLNDQNIFQGTTFAVHDADASPDRDPQGPSDFTVEGNETDFFQSFSTGANSEVFFVDTSNLDIDDYDFNGNADIEVRNLGLSVEIDDLNVTTNGEIEGTVTTRSSNRPVTIDLVDDGGDGDTVATQTPSVGGQGDVDFTFSADRDTGAYAVEVLDNNSGVDVVSSAITISESDSDANFAQNTISEQRGDIVEIVVETEDADFASITVGEADGSEGILANATVEDENDDGQVTVYLNTFDFLSGSGTTDVFAVDDDSDDSISSQDLSGTGTVGGPDGTTSDLIDAGEYDLEVVAGETVPSDANGGADGVATMVIEERSTETLRMWTGSKEEVSANDLEDVNEAIANGEISQSSEIAVGDFAVHQLVASGFEGALDAREDEVVTDAFLTVDRQTGSDPGIFNLTLEEADPGANQNAEELNLSAQNTTVIADGPNDTYFVIVDTDDVEFAGQGGDGARSALPNNDDTAIEANFSVLSDDGAGADFAPDNLDDDEVEETITTFNANEPEIDIDEPFNVSQASAQTVSGTTNIAPGTELDLRIRSADGVSPSFLKTASPTIQSDGTFSATFDFSEQNVGDDYDIQANALVLTDGPSEESGTVVGAVATDTATPEPDTETATPEPDTDTPTPEPDTETATPEPDTETATPEPETDTPTSTPTSTPGFGVVVALTALLAAALLAIRRE
jgi:surface glycoprotein (TIGR04207 family)/PGF-CTERM protein